jgi:hypothetical protein
VVTRCSHKSERRVARCLSANKNTSYENVRAGRLRVRSQL